MNHILLLEQPHSETQLLELQNLFSAAGLTLADWDIRTLLPTPVRDITTLFHTATEIKKAGIESSFPFHYKNKTIFPSAELLGQMHTMLHSLPPGGGIILTMGTLPFWTLTDQTSVDKYRGSVMAFGDYTLFPLHSVARLFREFWLKRVTLRDLQRVKLHLDLPIPTPVRTFRIRPTYEEAADYLNNILNNRLRVSVDIETTASHFIGCIGLATSPYDAICISFLNEQYQSFFSEVEELHLISLLRLILLRCRTIFQNGAFDAQYFARDWGIVPRHVDDTMLAHHVCFNSIPKDLGFLSSLYLNHHVYWKDEGKFIDEKKDFKQWWLYNCKDTTNTFEIMLSLEKQLESLGLRPQYDFQISMWHRVLRTMIRGVLINQQAKLDFAMQVHETIANIESELDYYSQLFPQTKTPWYNSPTQLAHIFYDLLQYPTFFNKKTKQRSTDDVCLTKLRKVAPLLSPLIDRILELRSLRVFSSTFLAAGLGNDGRMRTSYDLAGTVTYRFASRKDSFGGGMNLQNIPRNR